MKASRVMIPRMRAAFPLLINVVDARNTKSVAYLKRCGFTLLEAIPAGPQKMPFYPFFMES
jgi:hypothetical protein